MSDPWDLQRFVRAQGGGVYERALAEIRAGRKDSHWMWFIFPQLGALGRSPTAKDFGIDNLEEAAAYLAHPVLGPRLRACAEAAAAIRGRTAREVFGTPDDLKLRSSMTLFARVEGADPVFGRVLEVFYGAKPDPRTLELLASG